MRAFWSVVTAILFSTPVFAGQITVGPNVQVSKAHAEGAHFEVLAAADPKDPSRLIIGSFLLPETGETGTVVYATSDGGRTWQPTLQGKTLEYTGDPACAYGPDGTAYYVASFIPPGSPMGGTDRTMLIFRSKDGGKTWDEKPTVFTYTDREYITVDATGGKYNGRIYVNGNNRIPHDVSDIVVFDSGDNGASFQGPGKREGFGKFYATEMGNGVVSSDGTWVAVFAEGQKSSKSSYLQATTSTDGGLSLNPAVKIDDFLAGGDRKGSHNNANSLPALAIDSSGGPYKDHLYVVWPERRSGHSQIFFSDSADKGKTWSKGRAINDNPAEDTTDEFMPTIAVNRDGAVGVMWYDRRDHPDNLGWDARFTASVDGGETFLPSVKVSEKGTEFGPNARWTPLRSAVTRGSGSSGSKGQGLSIQMGLNSFMFIGGDTSGIAADAAGIFHPVWVDNRTGTPQIWTAAVTVTRPPSSQNDSSDISDQVMLELTDSHYDRSKNEMTTSARIANTSNQTLQGPFRVRVQAIQSELGDLTILNAENGANGIGAEWTFNNNALSPNEKSLPKTLRFHLSNIKPFLDGDHYRLGLLNMNVRVLGKVR